MTKTRILYGGGAAVTALCAGCTRWCHDRCQPRRHQMPVPGRRPVLHHAGGTSLADLAGHYLGGYTGLLRARRRCAAPGRQHRRQLEAYPDHSRDGKARSYTIHSRWRIVAKRGKVHTRPWVEQYVARIWGIGYYERRKSAHGHHQPVLQRLHLAPHGLMAGRGWTA